MTEKLKKTRPRKREITEYSKDDKGSLVFPRSEFQCEVDGIISTSGHAYIHRDLQGKRFKLLIYRDEEKNEGQD